MKTDFQKRTQICNQTKEQLREAVGQFNKLLGTAAQIRESEFASMRELESQIIRSSDDDLASNMEFLREKYRESQRRVFFTSVAYYISTKCRDVTMPKASGVISDEHFCINWHKEGDPTYQDKMNAYSKLLLEFDFEHVLTLTLKFQEQGDRSDLETCLSKYGQEVIDALPYILGEPDHSGAFEFLLERRAYLAEQGLSERETTTTECSI